MKKRNVMVVFGGKSGEHEVSLLSATSVMKAMNREKYNIIPVGITKDGIWKLYEGPVEYIATGKWEQVVNQMQRQGSSTPPICLLPVEKQEGYVDLGNNRMEKIDVVFPVLHGPNGEDGTIQGLLEIVNIPYVGAGVLASALAMDKAVAKKLLEGQDLPQANYAVIRRKKYKTDPDTCIAQIEDEFEYPVFVKPANMGSSVGISKARNKEQLQEALELASQYDHKIVVEEFIDGREIECSVLGNEEPIASLPSEIIPSHEFYDYHDKYFDGKSQFSIPADLPDWVTQEVRNLAIKVYQLLDCSGLARVDFFVERKTNRILINEVNTMPGFTKISMYPKMWEASGLPYEQLIDRLIELALERFHDRNELK